MLANVWSALKLLALFALLAAGAVGLAVLAWRSMNVGTLVCFGLVVAGMCYGVREHLRLLASLAVAEARLVALEERTGNRRAYLYEWDIADFNQGFFGGALVDHLQWPGSSNMTKWREAHWEGWSASLANLQEQARTLDEDAWDGRYESLLAEQPFLPPPAADDDDILDYWSNPTRWHSDAFRKQFREGMERRLRKFSRTGGRPVNKSRRKPTAEQPAPSRPSGAQAP